MMFNKLRRKFILLSVCSVFVVLAIILGTINIINYVSLVVDAEDLIAVLQEGGGNFGEGADRNEHFSPETPFVTRYFTVTIAADGTVAGSDTDRIAAVSEQEAEQIALDLFGRGKTSGFYGRYRYGATDRDGETMYVFVDCSMDLSNFYRFLYSSIAVGMAGLAVVFVLIFLFSGRAVKPLAESYRKQKRFITDAGHEIKTPLTIIGANAEIIEMQCGESEWTLGIKEQINRLASLTKKLIFLARMDEETKIAMFEFCISDAVRESVQPFEAVAVSQGVTLRTEIGEELYYTGNREMIGQLAALLVDNAIKYTDGDSVDVSLREEGGKLFFTVRNRASYLQDGALDGMFERFRRGDASRNSRTGGQGIGLSVAKAIVTAHKGKISADCTGGKVTFAVQL